MTERLHLSPKHRAVVEALLREHLPGVEVWAYGSRVNGRSHDGSDLDLVLRGPGLQEIPIDQLGDFAEAVRDSTIPFLVEARDWAWLPERFHREIERGYMVLVGKETLRKSTLGELLSFSNGKTSPERTCGSSHPVYGSNGVIGFSDETNAPPETIVIGRVGSYCGSLHFSDSSCWVTDNAIRANAVNGNDSRFLFYLLQTLRLNDRRSGSGQPLLNQSILSSIPVVVPLPPEQRAIAHILGTLDDKIELNRRMNETLEAMARALFKSWFVDFDPVRAKAAFRNHATLEEESPKQGRGPEEITPPLRGSRGDKDASPQASRWGESGATQPPRPWPDIKRQYAPKTLQHAQTLRQNQTNAEGLLWHYLRNKQLGGYKFRRQQPIGPYIADFACLPEKLLIELDGGQHAEPNAPDEQRDRFLRQQGYRVLRFWNHEVFADCFGVLERVYETLAGPPPHQPAPDGLASATPPQGGSDWSVDRARAYRDAMDPEIVALFPDRFVDSELGEIPAGWEVKALPELIEVNPKRSLQQGELAPYLDMANMPTKGHVPGTVIQRPFSSGMRFANGDTLVARITPCLENGKTAYVDFLRDGEIGWGSTEYIVMRPKSPLPSEFAYCLARSVEFRDFAIQNMTGTSGRQRVPAKALSQFMFLLAPDQIAESFGRAVQPLLRRASRAVNNSRALAAFRGTLLPKLISGELRLRGWEGGQSCGPEC